MATVNNIAFQAAAIKRELQAGPYDRQVVINRCKALQAQAVKLGKNKTQEEAFAALREIHTLLSSSTFSEKLKGFRERVVKIEALSEIGALAEVQSELEALTHLEKELQKFKDLKSENVSEFAELIRRRQVVLVKLQSSLKPGVFESMMHRINKEFLRTLGISAAIVIAVDFYTHFRYGTIDISMSFLEKFLCYFTTVQFLSEVMKMPIYDLKSYLNPVLASFGIPVIGKMFGLDPAMIDNAASIATFLLMMIPVSSPLRTRNLKTLTSRVGLAGSLGMIANFCGLSFLASLNFAWMGAWMHHSLLTPAKRPEQVAKPEIQAANVLAQFFYDNFSSQLTSQRIDDARKEITISDELMKLGSSAPMSHDFGAYLGILEKETKAKKVPSGIVITNATNTKSFSIGLDIDQKGKFVVAILDPVNSSCIYCPTIQDAAVRAKELIIGKEEWHVRRAVYKRPEDPILLDPIERNAQVKIGKKIVHVKSEMVRFISDNKNLTTFSIAYTFDELCDLFRKASIYFAPKGKTLKIQALANCFLDSFTLPNNEEDALKALVSAITLNGQNRTMVFKSERERKETFRKLVALSGKFSKEDIETFFADMANQDDAGVRYEIGEIRVFDTLPKNGIWKKVHQNWNLTTLRYMGPSRTLVLR